jgi:hypothetical protein
MRFSLTLIVVVATLFLSGCPQQQTQRVQPSSEDYRPAPSYLEHTIVYSGETLAEIALHYTGRATNWMAIMDANPGIRPERLRIGQVILIPRQLVVNERPFVKTVSKKSSAKQPAAESPAHQDAAPQSEDKPAETTPAEDTAESSELAPEPTSALTVAPTVAPTATPAPTIVPLVVPSTPAATSATPDNEREKLLDELLQ